ncbi:MAG: 3-phenylpropionate/cinnamic acid dioxygenase small subunit [Gammaproteobacteria bacterium]|jgi:3-phenylpropionate/cinnamic acid dioxygenase small subunit
MHLNHDSSKSSQYVSNEFYEQLVSNFTDWQQSNAEVSDHVMRDNCRRFLEREARYLQDLRFSDWLSLYATECIYWVPTTSNAGDPRTQVAIAFDDRRRLEDRIYRLELSSAWSQRPPSRTVRMVGNIELYTTDSQDVVMVRSNLLINEFWGEENRLWGAWCGHRLKRKNSDWEILVKQVNLIDCDQNLRNPSIIL